MHAIAETQMAKRGSSLKLDDEDTKVHYIFSILCVPKIFQNKNFRVIEDLVRCETYENVQVPTRNRAPIFIIITSVCPTFLSFLIRNIFKAKQCGLEIEYNYVSLEHG